MGETIDRPIGRDPHHRQRMSSRAVRGRSALTRILDVEPVGDLSLVRLTIGTGRTHQIRVHLSEAGHPVVGDAIYGGARRCCRRGCAVAARLDRPFLHALKLAITHPTTGARLTFEAPLAPDLVEAIEALRRAHASPESLTPKA